jgi:hypothetical protein
MLPRLLKLDTSHDQTTPPQDKCHLPVIHRLIRRQQDQIQRFEHIPLLDLSPQQQTDGIVESRQGSLQHQLVGSGQWADDVEVEVGRGFGEDQVWRQGVNVACARQLRGQELLVGDLGYRIVRRYEEDWVYAFG